MINLNTIRSTLLNPNLEPELYQKVYALQLHTCNSKCSEPVLSSFKYKKEFFRFFAECIYYDPNNYDIHINI